MYAFISGVIDYIDPNGLVVVDNNGIGYNINVSLNTLAGLPSKEIGRASCRERVYRAV